MSERMQNERRAKDPGNQRLGERLSDRTLWGSPQSSQVGGWWRGPLICSSSSVWPLVIPVSSPCFEFPFPSHADGRGMLTFSAVLWPETCSQTGCSSVCSRYHFFCDSGCCIDITLACDGVTQCPDGSDEDFCQNCESVAQSCQAGIWDEMGTLRSSTACFRNNFLQKAMLENSLRLESEMQVPNFWYCIWFFSTFQRFFLIFKILHNIHFFKIWSRSGKMTQKRRCLLKPHNLNLIPRTHMVGREAWLLQIVLWPPPCSIIPFSLFICFCFCDTDLPCNPGWPYIHNPLTLTFLASSGIIDLCLYHAWFLFIYLDRVSL